MKYLTDYTQEAQTALFKELGVFFAFSDKHFEEKKKPLTLYMNMGQGMVAPIVNADEVRRRLSEIYQAGIAADLAENGKEAIIRRELNNYECGYSQDITPCVDALVDYDITEEEIMTQFREATKDHVWVNRKRLNSANYN